MSGRHLHNIMLLTIRDLSNQLQIKTSTLYSWVAEGKIPALKLNGLIRFEPDAIKAWLNSSSAPSSQLSLPSLPTGPCHDIDRVIARAKRDVYTSLRGRPDQDRAMRKGGTDGSV